MIVLYYWPTPNGQKVSIMLEEIGIPYAVQPINILEGDQHEESFGKINPNKRIPAITDDEGPAGSPCTLFESGAILQYLSEKSGQLLSRIPETRYQSLQWLCFQLANVGPMFGQCGHFMGYASEDIPYAKDRYFRETLRLYGVLNDHLERNEYLAVTYSIADIATFPWTLPPVRALHRIEIDQFPNVKRWIADIDQRPAVQRGIALLEEKMQIGDPTDEARAAMFGKK